MATVLAALTWSPVHGSDAPPSGSTVASRNGSAAASAPEDARDDTPAVRSADGPSPAEPVASPPAADAAARLEEVVVTARRRPELVYETPVSVTAFDGATLRATQVQSIDQLVGLVPNLVYYTTGSGQDATPFIRGVGSYPAVFLDSGVGTYVDGVYLARAPGSLLDIVDFEQVEVLRGPQGTLFGKNTIGGAINVTTTKPKNRLEAAASVRGGTLGELDSRAMLNLPIPLGELTDVLATRFSFGSRRTGGYTTNALTGDDYSNQDALDFYGAMRFAPRDDLTFDLTGTWSRDRTRGLGGECRVVPQSTRVNPATGATNNPFNGFLPSGYRGACNRSEPYRFESDVAPPTADLESYGLWGILDWDLGRAGPLDLRLRYTGSWREQVQRVRSDLEMTGLPVFTFSGIGDAPRGAIDGGPTDQQQVQQEVQLGATGWDDRISLVSGAFLYWEDADEDTALLFLPGNPILDGAGGTTLNRNVVSNRSWALYGQGTVDVTTWLSLTGGLRYTQERKSLARRVTIPRSLNPADPVLTDFSNAETFGAWTPMASIAFETPEAWLRRTGVVDWAMPYFTYSRGFTGGGINGAGRSTSPLESRSFQPELANSYEWGIKTLGFGRRLSANVDYFVLDRRDQQVPQLVQDTSACPPSGDPDCVPPTLSIITNAARSRTRGFETELQARPVDALLVTANVGYTLGRYLDYPGAVNSITNATINRAGQRFPFVPEWTTHVGAQYTWPVPDLGGPSWLRGSLTPRIDWSYIGSVAFYAPEIAPLMRPGYDLLDVRLSFDFNGDTSQVAFWMKNATDTEYFNDALAWPRLTGSVVRYYAPPRTIGVEISQRF
jgi:iron complex outermembrane receptor protein